jgi:pyruvate/2-oxoglutarate dehydrogenase complex dihydrolipoamide dehydrogenase (E3) component
MADEHYDAIVIGTSQGGRFLPVELAKAGQKVALVERDQLGGVCVNTGCTPTKTMVASARLAYQARRAAARSTACVLVRYRWTWPRSGSANGPWSPARGRTTRAAWPRTGST